MIRRVDIWDLVLKDPDTMRVLQHNQQLALLSIIQAIHVCNTQLVLPATIVIKISKADRVDRIILQDRVDQMIIIAHQAHNAVLITTVDQIILQDRVVMQITMTN